MGASFGPMLSQTGITQALSAGRSSFACGTSYLASSGRELGIKLLNSEEERITDGAKRENHLCSVAG